MSFRRARNIEPPVWSCVIKSEGIPEDHAIIVQVQAMFDWAKLSFALNETSQYGNRRTTDKLLIEWRHAVPMLEELVDMVDNAAREQRRVGDILLYLDADELTITREYHSSDESGNQSTKSFTMPIDALNTLLENVDHIVASGNMLDERLMARTQATEPQGNAHSTGGGWQGNAHGNGNRWQGNSTQYDKDAAQNSKRSVSKSADKYKTPQKKPLAAFSGTTRTNLKRLPTKAAATEKAVANFKAARQEKEGRKNGAAAMKPIPIAPAAKTAKGLKKFVTGNGEKAKKGMEKVGTGTTRKRLRLEKSSSSEMTVDGSVGQNSDDEDDEQQNMTEAIESEVV